jgi:outer membrane protein OmpA-like peptidoglycan-associated protein
MIIKKMNYKYKVFINSNLSMIKKIIFSQKIRMISISKFSIIRLACVLILMEIIIPFSTFSQSARLKYADKMYDAKSYAYASEAYEDVISRKKSDSSIVASRLADSYDKIDNKQKAVEWYNYLKRNNKITREQFLRLALLERGLQNYSSSDQLLAEYKKKYGDKGLPKDLFNSPTIEELKQKNGNRFSLRPQNSNTSGSEIGPAFFSSNEILFSSTKRRNKAEMIIDAWPGDYFYDIYKADLDDNGDIGKWTLMNAEAKTRYHDGPITYNQQTARVYFTRNNYIDGKKKLDNTRTMRLKIFRSEISGNQFRDLVELSINSDNYSTAHPAITADGRRMFFSSDRPGGFGGMDIYYVDLDESGNPIGEPVNLGNKVNTSQHEVFPSYNDKENLLFFSSDGHYGFGGLDVYAAKLDKQAKVLNIENLATPINSSSDDFCFITNEEQTSGFFCSNREGGKGEDDIYGFVQNEPIKNNIMLNGNTINSLTNELISEASIYLLNSNGTILDSTKTDENGNFSILLNGIKEDFTVTASKEAFVGSSHTLKFDESTVEYNDTLPLTPLRDYYMVGLVTDRETGDSINDVKVRIIDKNINQDFVTVNTDSKGKFKTGTLPYKYKNTVSYDLRLEKSGYITKKVDFNTTLDIEPEIYVNALLSNGIKMDKIVLGKTDLAVVFNLEPIYYDLNSSYIRKDAAVELDKIVQVMQDNPDMVVELGSHTDQRASDHYNMWLSDRRAKSAANYIISKGISKDRIYGKGYGESKPIHTQSEIDKQKSEEDKEKLYQINRRTEFIVVK